MVQNYTCFRGTGSLEDERLQRLKASEARNLITSKNVPEAEHVPELGLSIRTNRFR
ncbi:hypothetical protein A2U01_0095727, partial [Trifolium medium]|nr:hypothetical protein [Trifolium medium]